MASSTVRRKSLSETSSSPRSARWAFMTMRRYFVMVTPGIATGYWKAMKRPRRARPPWAFGGVYPPAWTVEPPRHPPRQLIVPSVTSNAGLPMIALASVDLPEPLGPMSACTSPRSTVRSRPRRICLSPAATWRLRISSSGTDGFLGVGERGEGDRGGREGHEVRERRAGQLLHDAALDAQPEEPGGAGLARVAVDVVAQDAALVALVDEAGHGRDGALERQDRVVHGDGRGVPGQAVATVRAAGALDE